MIRIVCFGKLKEKYLIDLCEDYLKRIKKYHKIEVINLKDDIKISNETDSLMKVFNKSHFNILLDIKGEGYSSEEFSTLIDTTFINYSNITFIIGGSNGVEDSVKELCNLRLSFSKFTMPHGLFRGVLLEQIYRAFKINNNEGYHK